jgi:hypothetical protein
MCVLRYWQLVSLCSIGVDAWSTYDFEAFWCRKTRSTLSTRDRTWTRLWSSRFRAVTGAVDLLSCSDNSKHYPLATRTASKQYRSLLSNCSTKILYANQFLQDLLYVSHVTAIILSPPWSTIGRFQCSLLTKYFSLFLSPLVKLRVRCKTARFYLS